MTQTKHCTTGVSLVLAALLVAPVVGGCGLSSITSGIGGGVFGGSSPKAETRSVSEDNLLTAAKAESSEISGVGGDVSHGCPRFLAWPRDHSITIYEPGRVGDGLAVMHRGEITKTARECAVEGGRVTVKYGFSGRVLLGPRGKDGAISLPLNVFVTDAKRERIAGDKVKVDVQVALDKPIGYFSLVRTVTFNVPEGARAGDFEVFVGFERNVPNAG